jgi:hypothetical protein
MATFLLGLDAAFQPRNGSMERSMPALIDSAFTDEELHDWLICAAALVADSITACLGQLC